MELNWEQTAAIRIDHELVSLKVLHGICVKACVFTGPFQLVWRKHLFRMGDNAGINVSGYTINNFRYTVTKKTCQQY